LMIKFDFIANPYVNAISPTNMTGGTQRKTQMDVSDRRLFMPYCGLKGENIQGSPGVGGRSVTEQKTPHPCPSPRRTGRGRTSRGLRHPGLHSFVVHPGLQLYHPYGISVWCDFVASGGAEKVEGL
jgi:hypothetical protein